MREGYEDLEDEVKNILNTEPIKSVSIKPGQESPSTIVELETARITITAIGGHGGAGLHWYKIEEI